MCLAIPGQILEFCDDQRQLAIVDVSGVRRKINIQLLEEEPLGPGDWVLIHVGFAMSRIDEGEAAATHELLEQMGAAYEQELAELKASVIE
jgi:hydrogenase expression/formation protein HypC